MTMRVLAGDIGGTSARLAVAEVEGRSCRMLDEACYASRDHASFASVLESFLIRGRERPQAACFAVAGPVQDRGGAQSVRVTNLPWQIESDAIASEFDLARVRLINDFQAVGYGIEALAPQDLVTLQAGEPKPGGPRAVLGAGTGLGQTVCVWHADHYEALPTEGGHAGFAPADDLQDDLLRYLRGRHGRVSCERVLSGPGLVQLYEFLKERGAAPESPDVVQAMQDGDPAAAISIAAQRGDRLASQALDLFVSVYGAHAGDLALTVLATGGVYVAGGIAPKIVASLKGGAFLRAFNDKGRMSALTQAMPVHVVMNESVGLLGAALVASRSVTSPES
jgi:glucokinase